MMTYLARLNFKQLQLVRQDPNRLWQMTADAAFDDAALISAGPEFERLCTALAGLKEPRSELLAAAGQGSDSQQLPADRIEFGSSSARTFSPVAVRSLSAGLKELRAETLRDALAGAPTGTAEHDAAGSSWLSPALAALAVLQRFYATAAGYGQYVLIAQA